MKTYSEILNYMARLCSGREYCISDIKKKLDRIDIKDKEKQSIIDTLVNKNFINEERYCLAYTNDHYKFSKWGKSKLKIKLKEKNIPDNIIEKSLKEINEEEYLNILAELIKTKAKKTKYSNTYEFKAKLLRFGTGRGFSPEEIYRCINQLKINMENED